METKTAEPSPRATPFSEAFGTQYQPEATPATDTPPAETKTETTPVAEPKEAATPKEPKEPTRIPRELKKDAAKKEDAATETEAEPFPEPTGLDTKAKAGWAALKKEARENKQKAAELERKIADWKSAGKDPETLEARLAEHEKKLADYEERVARADLELTDSFQKEIIEPTKKELARARALAQEVDANPDELVAALQLSGKARATALRELSMDLDAIQSGRLGRIMEKLDEFSERAESERANAKQSFAERQERERQERASAEAQQYKERLNGFENTARKLKASLEILNKVDGHEDWNTRADEILSVARKAVESNPNANPESEVLANSALAYRDLFLQADAKVEEYEKKIAEMEAELKSIHSKGPALTQRGTGSAPGDNKRPFSSAIAEAFGQ